MSYIRENYKGNLPINSHWKDIDNESSFSATYTFALNHENMEKLYEGEPVMYNYKIGVIGDDIKCFDKNTDYVSMNDFYPWEYNPTQYPCNATVYKDYKRNPFFNLKKFDNNFPYASYDKGLIPDTDTDVMSSKIIYCQYMVNNNIPCKNNTNNDNLFFTNISDIELYKEKLPSNGRSVINTNTIDDNINDDNKNQYNWGIMPYIISSRTMMALFIIISIVITLLLGTTQKTKISDRVYYNIIQKDDVTPEVLPKKLLLKWRETEYIEEKERNSALFRKAMDSYSS